MSIRIKPREGVNKFKLGMHQLEVRQHANDSYAEFKQVPWCTYPSDVSDLEGIILLYNENGCLEVIVNLREFWLYPHG